MPDSPTIVSASLDDKELQESINAMVSNFNKGLNDMKEASTKAVKDIQDTFKKLGETSMTSSGNVNDSGSSKRTKAQTKETAAVKETTVAYDDMAQAIDKVLDGENLTKSFNERGFVKLKNELRSVQAEYIRLGGDSSTNAKADELRQKIAELTRQVTQYELALKNMQAATKSSASFDIKGWVKDIDSKDIRLKQLAQWYSELEKQSSMRGVSESKITEEIRKQAEVIRNSQQFREKGFYFYDVDGATYVVEASKKNSIESQILRNQELQARQLEIQRDNEESINFHAREKAKHEQKALEIQESLSKAEQDYLNLRQSEEETQKKINKQIKDAKNVLEDVKNLQAQDKGLNISSSRELQNALEYINRLQEAYQNLGNTGRNSEVGKEINAYIKGLQRNISDLNVKVEEEILMNDKLGSSYVTLSRRLTRLQTQYQNLSEEERNSTKGNELADKIQRVSRTINDIQKQMSRPINLQSALNLPTKTLDDMAYKLRQLQAYKQGIDLTKPNAAEEVLKVDNAVNTLQKDMQKYMSTGKKVSETNAILGRSWNYMKNRLAFYFTVGASTAFVKNLVNIRGQYEMTERALGILVDSAERGTQIFKELSSMALVSPYTLIELSNAAKQLVAYDVAAKDVVETTRRLADMSSAVGVPIERLTYALGQIKAYGYLNSRDARMFLNTGIPLVKELSKYYTEIEGRLVSTADVYDRIHKKSVGYSEVVQVINSMTDENGRFFDYQAKMADTMKVQLANLTLAWNNFLNDFGNAIQPVIVAPIKGLKELLLHWKDLNTVIWDAIAVYGVYKTTAIATDALIVKGTRDIIKKTAATKGATVADYKAALATQKLNKEQAILIASMNRGNKRLLLAIMNMNLLSRAELKAITATKVLNAAWNLFIGGIKSATAALVGLAAKFAPLLAVFAVADLIQYVTTIGDIDKAISEGISESAKEASQSLKEMNHQLKESAIIEQVKKGTASTDEMNTAWQMIREEIEKSSDAGKSFITELMKEQDVAKRIVAGFDLAQKIELAEEKIKDLKVVISEDSWLWGAFGEGLVEDVADAAEKWAEFNEKGSRVYKGTVVSEIREAEGEMQKLAEHLQKQFDDLNIINPVEIEEALEHVRNSIKKENNISGENAKMFDSMYDSIMHKYFDSHDKATSMWNELLSTIKRNSSSLFANLSEEIIDGNKKWSTEQLNAIQKGVNELRKKFPEEFSNVLDKMQQMLDSREFRVKMVAEFGSFSTSFQKEYDARVREAGLDRTDYNALRPQEGEDIVKWSDRLRNNIKDAETHIKRMQDDGSAYAKTQVKIYEAIINKNQKALDLFSVAYKEDKGGSHKDILGEAMSKEIQYISDIQKLYKAYRKEGMSANDALTESTKNYEQSLKTVNATLSTFGVKGLTGDNIATMDLKQVRDYYASLLDDVKSSPKAVEAIEKAIKSLDEEINKTHYKTIVEGLNNELGKLKEEYELGIELDANPELGGMFADMLGIDTDELPRTFAELFDKANKVAQAKLKEAGAEYKDFDLLSTVIKGDEKNEWNGMKMDSDVVQNIIKWQKTFRDTFKKNIIDTEKDLDDFIKKYGTYADKIAEIEAQKQEKLKRLNDAYYTQDMQSTPEYQAKLRAIEKAAKKEEGQIKFDEFKNSRYYTMMFENLDFISTKTIRAIRDKLRELMNDMGSLTPEQLKTVIKQYEQLEQKLVKRSPFKTLGKDLREYLKVAGKGKTINKEFRDAQKNVEVQQEYVAELQRSHEILKMQPEATDEEIQKSADLLNIEKEKLQTLLEILDAKSKEAEKYNLTKKLAKSEALAVAQVVSSNAASLSGLRDFLRDDLGVEISAEFDGFVEGMNKMSEGVNSIISSAQSGDVVGVLTGVGKTVYGIYDGIASIFGGGSAKNKKIDKAIKESEREISKLENTINAVKNAYDQLTNAAERSYGLQKTGAQLAVRENQVLQLQYYQMQLTEKKRQLELEKSRSAKKRDADRINSLEGELISLQSTMNSLTNEITNAIADITDELLGISRSSWAEDLTTALIEAFKQGEDYMEVFEGKWDDMVDHLIMKLIVGNLIGDFFNNEVLGKVDDIINDMTKDERDYVRILQDVVRQEQYKKDQGWDNDLNFYEEELEKALAQLDAKAADAALEAYKLILQDPTLKERLNARIEALPELLEPFGISYGQDSDKQLSGLQAGIQGITEETAGAIEAYLNIVSQRMFEHGNILMEIRDIVASFDLDIHLGVQQQMLLQLQNSYQVQMTIQSILQGWSNASGMAVRVEMV